MADSRLLAADGLGETFRLSVRFALIFRGRIWTMKYQGSNLEEAALF